MARNFTGGTDHLVVADRASFDGTSGAVACLFKTSTTGAYQYLLSRDGDLGSFGVERQWQLRVDSGNTVSFLLVIGAVPTVTSSGTYTDGSWHSAVGTWSWDGANTTLELFMDGVSQGTTSSANSLSASATDVWIGSYDGRGTPTYSLTGDIAQVAMWVGDKLVLGEAAALSDGFVPTLVRPSLGVMDLPLVRELNDLRGAAATATGTTVAVHPRVIQKRRKQVYPPSAAAPSTTVARLVNKGLVGSGLVGRGRLVG